MSIITAETHEALLCSALIKMGVPEEHAPAIAAARWPMEGSHAILAELEARGLRITADDIHDWLVSVAPDSPGLHDPDCTLISRGLLESLIAWCVENQRGAVRTMRPSVSIDDMLAGLRSPDRDSREAHGVMLAASLGAGMRLSGETMEDVEHILAPAVLQLIEAAIEGDAAAVDELAAQITEAYTPAPATPCELPARENEPA